MLTSHALAQVAPLAQEVQARGILTLIGHAIGVFILVVLLIGILIGFVLGRMFGRR